MKARAASSFVVANETPARVHAETHQSIFATALHDGGVVLCLIAIALWTLTHPFQGIAGDTNVYIGRALADLNPTGVGRDMMFVDDGQSRFSLFPFLLDHLVAALGTQTTVMMLAILAMVAWTSALAFFARHYVGWRFVPVVLIFVAVLPTFYGSIWHFGYSEVQSVPRPFAEACVLGALAALASRRALLSVALLVPATLLHPIMALAGWVVLAIVLCVKDRRWLIAAGLTVAAAIIAGVLGLPLFDRLVRLMDPDLKALAQSRSGLLFPTHWSIASYAPIVLQSATIASAARFFEGRRKLILLAVVLAGIGGIAAQSLFGDELSLELVIQAQFWRMTWLLAAIGAVSMAICAIKLIQNGRVGYLVLALLTAAWLCYLDFMMVSALCAAALVVQFSAPRLASVVTRRVVIVVWICVAAYGLLLNVLYFEQFGRFFASLPAEGPGGFTYFWNNWRYIAFPIAGGALALALAPRARVTWAIEGFAALALAAVAWHLWDDRSAFQKIVDRNRRPAPLEQLLAGKDGEILWLGGQTEAWFLTGRPQWASPQQGVGTIFSPKLAREWRGHMQFLIDNGLVEKEGLAISHNLSSAELPVVTAPAVGRLCARADAPAWIVAPVYEGATLPAALKAQFWTPPVPNFRMTEEPDGYVWHRISTYAVLPCVGAQL
ncbi:MAG TPA: hypothetical protein VGB93_02255 [Methylovirgula sp.]